MLYARVTNFSYIRICLQLFLIILALEYLMLEGQQFLFNPANKQLKVPFAQFYLGYRQSIFAGSFAFGYRII